MPVGLATLHGGTQKIAPAEILPDAPNHSFIMGEKQNMVWGEEHKQKISIRPDKYQLGNLQFQGKKKIMEKNQKRQFWSKIYADNISS